MDCSKHVYSGERGDIRGHPCGNKASVTENGKPWCRIHAPSAELRRKNKSKEKYLENEKQRNREWQIGDIDREIVAAVLEVDAYLLPERLRELRKKRLALDESGERRQ